MIVRVQGPEDKPISISGLWLRRIGENAEVLIEVDGKWRKMLVEHVEASFSHIIEPAGMRLRIEHEK